MGTCSIAILATLDTKAGEAAYLRQRIEDLGWTAKVFDVGLSEAPSGLAGVAAEEVALAGESSVSELRAGYRRDLAMQAMGVGAGRLLKEQHRAGRLAGAIGVGGNQGTAIARLRCGRCRSGCP